MSDVRKLTWRAEFADHASGAIKDVDDKFTGLAGAASDSEDNLKGAQKGLEDTKDSLTGAGKELDDTNDKLKDTDETLKGADKTSKSFGDSLKGIGGKMDKLGGSLTKKLTLPLVGVGTAAIATTSKIDDGLSRVGALTNATEDEFERLKQKALDLGQNTAFSASEAAEGMQILAASGMDANDVIENSGAMMTLMSAGTVDADTAASVLTNTMAQFGDKVKDSNHIVDVFSQGAAAAKLGVEDLEHIMGVAGGTLGSMNMDMEQSVAAAGQLANAGMPIGQVGSALNAMGREMKSNAKGFKKLGVSVYDSNGQMRDMGAVMADLEGKLKGKTNAERDAALATVFSGQAMKGATDWLNMGAEAYGGLTNELYGAEGAGESFAEAAEDNIGGALRSMSSSMETLMYNIGEALAPTIKAVAGAITNLADRFSALTPEQQEMIVKIGAIIAVAGPLIMMFGKIIGAMSPMRLIVMIVVGAFAVLIANWDKVKATADKVRGAWNDLRQAMRAKISGAVDILKDKFERGVNSVKKAWEGLKNFFKNPIKGTVEVAKKGAGWVKDKFTGRADGRNRTGKDRIPFNGYRSELHKGEMVLTKATADKFRAMGGTKDSLPAPQVTPVSVPSSNKGDKVVNFNPNVSITIEGNVDEDVARDLDDRVKNILASEFAKLMLQGV